VPDEHGSPRNCRDHADHAARGARRCPGSIPRRGAEGKPVLGVLRIARDPAKVEDQVRLLARTLDNLALEPDGTAAASGTDRVPACGWRWSAASSGFDSHRRLSATQCQAVTASA